MRAKSSHDRNLRERIAQEAARIMVQGGIRDFQLAKRKALDRLGARWSGKLPSNEEIDAAVGEYQRLFRSHCQPQRLRDMREAALGVMRLISDFEPRLVGSVLAGTADHNAKTTLHATSEPSELLGIYLTDHRVPSRLSERRLRMTPESYRRFPAYEFASDDVAIEVVVFDVASARQAPLSPIDGRPMRRAKLSQVEALVLDEGS